MARPGAAGDTAETLAARVLEAEHRLLPAVVAAFARCGGASVCFLASDALGPAASLPGSG